MPISTAVNSTVTEREIFRFLRIIRRQQRVSAVILHYDCLSRKLIIWYWPVTELQARVTPEDLGGYRNSHHFRAPCCLCSHSSGSHHYAECAIDIADNGDYLGEYVAICASRSCKYLVPLDRLYARPGLRLCSFPRSYYPTANTQRLSSHGDLLGSRSLAASAEYPRFVDVTADIARLPLLAPQAHTITEAHLRRLDDSAGLSQTAVAELLVKCWQCSHIMTKRAFHGHVCGSQPNSIVIDLTSEESS